MKKKEKHTHSRTKEESIVLEFLSKDFEKRGMDDLASRGPKKVNADFYFCYHKLLIKNKNKKKEKQTASCLQII